LRKLKGICLAAALLLCACGSPAPASDDPEFDNAVKLFNQKRYSDAIHILTNIINRPKCGPGPIYYAGLSYQYVGNMTMAQECYRVLANVFPESAEAKMSKPVLERLTKIGAGKAANTFNAGGSETPKGAASAKTAAGASDSRRASVPRDPDSVAGYLRGFAMTDEEWKALPDESKVPFKRASSSHLYVNGSVNGRNLDMMFDTGAEQCHFSRKQLENLGVRIDTMGAKIPVQGVGGIAYSQMMMADVTIGNLKRRIPILVDDVNIGMPIVGETFFKEFRYDIDNSGGFIRFSKKPRAGLASRSFEATDVIAIPYKNMGDNMVVTCKVNGKEFPMIFDTGSFAICLSLPHAMMLGLQIPDTARVMMTSGAGGSVRAYEFYVDRIELGPLIKTHVPVVVNESRLPPLPLLGQPFYKDKTFSVDTEKHLIKFAH
jgi:clan AA aspartic protease (TIGR02281 family)